ncbi:MAG: hypothetical protein H7833_00225 [Magnetococcus sp. DMHC-1]
MVAHCWGLANLEKQITTITTGPSRFTEGIQQELETCRPYLYGPKACQR